MMLAEGHYTRVVDATDVGDTERSEIRPRFER